MERLFSIYNSVRKLMVTSFNAAKSLLPACCVTADFKEIEPAQVRPHLPSLSRVTYRAVISEDHMESFPSPAI